ncbi:hypothetical protein ACFFRR_005473 [Megaselia abdita]
MEAVWEDVTATTPQRVIVPFKVKPHRRISKNIPPGLEMDLRLNNKYDLQPIEVVTFDPWHEEDRPFYPTQFRHPDHPYWDAFKDLPEQYWDGQEYDMISQIDGAGVCVRLTPCGKVFVRREGVEVVIRYEDGGNGGYTAPEKLRAIPPRTPQKPRRKEPCVKTLDIPLECPYWTQLLDGLVSPVRGLTNWVRSAYDGVKCLILMEMDGRVEVRRDNVQVQLLGRYKDE